jgi:hypothetical protein
VPAIIQEQEQKAMKLGYQCALLLFIVVLCLSIIAAGFVQHTPVTAAPAERPQHNLAPTYRIFATREGLVGLQTANGHIIQERDRFVALPSWKVLSSYQGYEYQVRVTYNGRSVVVPVWDVGPWNTNDNYWSPNREQYPDLPIGMPQAQAAFFDGHNGGLDEFGRIINNPNGIDIADGTFWDDLGMTRNDWVEVSFLWLGEDPGPGADAQEPVPAPPAARDPAPPDAPDPEVAPPAPAPQSSPQPAAPTARPTATQVPPDSTPPQSQIVRIVRERNGYRIEWDGEDDSSGIDSYDIQVRQLPRGRWRAWGTGVITESAWFGPDEGDHFAFRARARDNAGNEEDWPEGEQGDMDTYQAEPEPES